MWGLHWLRNTATAQWPERGGSAVSAHSNPGSLQSMDASAMTAALRKDLHTQNQETGLKRVSEMKLFCFEQIVWAETESMLWYRLVQAEDASSSRGCWFHCPGSKGKQREEGGVEYLGQNEAIGQETMSQARQPSCWKWNRVERDSSESCETWESMMMEKWSIIFFKPGFQAAGITIMSESNVAGNGEQVSRCFFHEHDDYHPSICIISHSVGGLYFIFCHLSRWSSRCFSTLTGNSSH